MRRTLPILCLTLLAFVVAACGGDDDGGSSKALDIFFAPENADALAHASLPAAADLPGDGWQITAQDDFSSSSDNDFDFAAFAETEPSCSGVSALSAAGGILGDDSDEPAGKAKVEFENASTGAPLPNSIEVEVKIEDTVEEVDQAWDTVKGLFESDDTETCMLAVFNEVFGQLADQDIKVDVTPVEASSDAPNDGASMAFNLHLNAAGQELDLAMEMYLWPYGNAKVSAQFMGTPDTLNAEVTGPTLDAVATKLEAAAGSEG
jgi:hypothetical protein